MNNIFDKYKILIVDDENEIIDILKTVLTIEGFNNIYTANTGKEGVETFVKIRPDIVLLDIMLPDTTGYDVFKEMRLHSEVPILFISAKTEEIDRLLGFALGADDYITKPFSAKEVAFRIKARLKAFNNINNIENKSIKFDDIEIDADKGNVYKNGELLDFTAKELKLLLYLVNNPNRILSKEMICNEVWGEDFFGYDNTITVHIRKLRMKIEADPSNPKYITTVIGLGYKMKGV
ncbi:MAG: response regulator transcription factor [Clostridium sp.]